MNRSLHCLFRILATAACLTPIALGRPSLASPLLADAQDVRRGDVPASTVLAQGAPADTAPVPPPSEETHKKGSSVDHVEARIQDLHHNLQITAAQETQWRDFAQVMRDNAKAIDAILKDRSANISKMNAVDDLRSYQKLADAHAEGMRKLVPAFETLYSTMSADQKKNADAVFGKFERRPHAKG